MNRFKVAMKAALVPFIIGIVGLVIGLVLLFIGLSVGPNSLLWVGLALCFVGIGGFFGALIEYKNTMRAICPECKKFMGDTNGVVNYSYVCTEYKDNYDSSTHKYNNTTFYYTCTIQCPHCGSTPTFDYKVTTGSESKANVQVDNYIKGILKIKK